MRKSTINLYQGESVRHKARPEWGVGKVTAVNTCGTIKVIFEDNKEVSIAQAAKYLEKICYKS